DSVRQGWAARVGKQMCSEVAVEDLIRNRPGCRQRVFVWGIPHLCATAAATALSTQASSPEVGDTDLWHIRARGDRAPAALVSPCRKRPCTAQPIDTLGA